MSKCNRLEYPFDLSEYEGLDVKSIVIRETDGTDERNALLNVKAKGANHTNMHEEMIALSVVEVDGSPIAQPFTGMGAWNSATRNTVARLYEDVNSARDVGPLLKAKKPRNPTR